VGTDSMTALTSGVGNVCVGLKSQISSTTGSTNVTVGNSSLFSLTTGIDNIAIGEKAGYDSGNASRCHVTGNQCIFIGTSARPSSQNLTNATAIGNTAIVDADNTIQLGNTAVTSVKTSGTITAATPTTGSHLTTKTYVDDKFTTLSNQNLKTTDAVTFASATINGNVTSTGNISTSVAPTTANHLTTKTYVDGKFTTLANQNLKTTDTVTFGGLKMPTVGGTAGTLNHYEEYVHTTAFSSATYTSNFGLLFVRIGKLVTMTFPDILTFTAIMASKLTNTVLVPERFRSPGDLLYHIEIIDNDVRVDGLVELISGYIIISPAHSTNFITGRTYTTYGFSMSWVLQ